LQPQIPFLELHSSFSTITSPLNLEAEFIHVSDRWRCPTKLLLVMGMHITPWRFGYASRARYTFTRIIGDLLPED